MAIHKVHLAIPFEIERGLNQGYLIRNGAGVVRATALHPTRSAGSIVGHLREVDPGRNGSARSVLASLDATAMLQATTLLYLKVRFDRVESLLHAIHHQGSEILATMNEVKTLLYLDFARPAAAALEFLRRYQHDREAGFCEEARLRFIEAAAGLRLLLRTHTAERLIENGTQLEAIFRTGSVCVAGELHCATVLGKGSATRIKTLEDYESIWREADDALDKLVPPSRRIPTIAMLRASNGDPMRARAHLQGLARERVDACRSERVVLDAIQTLPTETWDHWVDGANRGEHEALFVEEPVDEAVKNRAA